MDLTLLIYLVYMLGSLRMFFITIGLACGMLVAAWFLVAMIRLADERNSDIFNAWKKYAKRLIATAVVCSFIAAFIPSERFLVLMAASEVGKQVISTDIAKDSVDLLNVWIQQERQRILKSITKE